MSEIPDPNDPNFVIVDGRRLQIARWRGHRYFMCPFVYESGVQCTFGGYCLEVLDDHRRGHAPVVKPAPQMMNTGILAPDGREVLREVSADLAGASFAPEDEK